jgi:hypothetical protein
VKILFDPLFIDSVIISASFTLECYKLIKGCGNG